MPITANSLLPSAKPMITSNAVHSLVLPGDKAMASLVLRAVVLAELKATPILTRGAKGLVFQTFIG